MASRRGAGGKSAEAIELRRILKWSFRSDLFRVYAAQFIPVPGFVLTAQEQKLCDRPQSELEKQMLSQETVSMLAASRGQRTGSADGLE
ncbi:hypothetical protein D3C71_1371910 [compost metagenome]